MNLTVSRALSLALGYKMFEKICEKHFENLNFSCNNAISCQFEYQAANFERSYDNLLKLNVEEKIERFNIPRSCYQMTITNALLFRFR